MISLVVSVLLFLLLHDRHGVWLLSDSATFSRLCEVRADDLVNMILSNERIQGEMTMSNLYRKYISVTLMGVISLALSLYSDARGDNAMHQYSFITIPNGFYAGVFGGWGHSGNNNASQDGTAFFGAAKGGPFVGRALVMLAAAWVWLAFILAMDGRDGC